MTPERFATLVFVAEENEAADEGQAGEGSTAPENDAVQEPADVDPVSYTHLTLPTIA